MVEVEWAPSASSVFLVAIQVEALDRSRLLSDVTRVLSDQHVNILSASVTTTRDRVAMSRFTFEMGDPKHLGHVLRAVRGRRRRVRRLPGDQRQGVTAGTLRAPGAPALTICGRPPVDARERAPREDHRALDRRQGHPRGVHPHGAGLQPRDRRAAGRGRAGRAQRDVADAVAAADTAFEEWSQTSLSKRTKVLFAFRELVNRQRRRAGRADRRRARQGVLRRAGRGPARPRGGRVRLRHPAPCSRATTPTRSRPGWTPSRSASRSGVVAGITPFNFPAMVPMWMYPVAIACGNTFVLKPSERDPSASLLRRRAVAAGRAAGRRLQRRARRQGAVDALLDDPGVAAVSFVGSTPIAQYIHQRGSANGKRVQALGGAKNHAIVLPDADLDFAAEHLAAAAFGSAGERCMAISAAVAVGSAGRRGGRGRQRQGPGGHRRLRPGRGQRDGSGRHQRPPRSGSRA